MANRVLIGDRGGSMGMWISRPGYNVLTAGNNDMLFVASNSQNTRSFQTVQQGSFTISNNQVIDIAFPYLGVLPLILAWTDTYFYNPWSPNDPTSGVLGLEMQFPSSTVVRFIGRNEYMSATAGFRYLITNQSLY